jgi:Mg2+/Co2+ transporter CorB
LDPDPLPLLSLLLILFKIEWFQFGLVIFLLICSALVSGAEVAFFSLQLKSLEESNETENKIEVTRVIKLLKKLTVF